MKRVLAWACALALLTVTGCSSVTQGTGQPGLPASASHSVDFPSALPSAPSSARVSLPPSSSPVPTAKPTAAGPTRQQREDGLTAQTNGEAHLLVKIPNGYEAATFDQQADIQFWRSVGKNVDWTQVGTSTYPYSPSIGGPADAKVSGALLSGMQNATFIVTGSFTADSSGNAVAYTTGDHGWGVIKAEPNGNIGPSGQPVGSDRIGLSYGFGFAAGKLKTQDCPANEPIVSCGSDHVDKLWKWTGHDFTQS